MSAGFRALPQERAIMTALAGPAKQDSALVKDIGRDWRSWNVAERRSAVTILTLASIAVPVALLILTPF
jgi:hypothetical protein